MSIFSIAVVGIVMCLYATVAVCLLKCKLKDVYKRRTRKEKLLTIGLLFVSVGAMMLFAARQEAQPRILGPISLEIMNILSWLFYGDMQVMTLGVYIVCAMPVILISVLLLEKVALQWGWMELPFHYYLLLFLVNIMFYHPIRVSISGWFIVLALSSFLYCMIDMVQNGKNKKKITLLGVVTVLIAAILVAERAIEMKLLIEYAWTLVESFVMAVAINRVAVLRKTLWCILTAVCYFIVFFGHISLRM